MTNFVFANNVNTTLAGAISAGATSFTLSSSAHLPTSIPAGYCLVITLNDVATRGNFEVIYVGTVSGATCSNLLRGQEGTGALSWLTGDYAYSAPTDGQMNALPQLGTANTFTGNNTFSDPVVVAAATAPQDAVQLEQLFVGAGASSLKGQIQWDGPGTYSFTVPNGITTVYGSGAAAGGGGGGGGGSTNILGTGAGGAGGSAGEPVYRQAYTVVPGSVITVTIGATATGGTAGTPSASGGTGVTGGNITISGSGFNGGTPVTLTGGSGGVGGGTFTNTGTPSGGAPSGSGFPNGGCGLDGASGATANGGGGMGASSPFGGGGGSGRAGSTGVTGSPAYLYGGGGGGGGGGYGGTGGGANGGPGGAGGEGMFMFEW